MSLLCAALEEGESGETPLVGKLGIVEGDWPLIGVHHDRRSARTLPAPRAVSPASVSPQVVVVAEQPAVGVSVAAGRRPLSVALAETVAVDVSALAVRPDEVPNGRMLMAGPCCLLVADA
jgi:hypothetical protein